MDKSFHPFSDIIVMLPPGVKTPDYTMNDSSVNVQFYHRKETEKDYYDLCNAPVNSPWFVMTNSYHRVVRKVALMASRDGGKLRPVIPYVSANYENCYRFSSCARTMEASKSINKFFDKRYVVDFDMVFHTESRAEFCNFLADKKSFGETSNEYGINKEDNIDRPTASTYLAFLSLKNQVDDLYKLVDKQKFGSRKMFLQAIDYPETDGSDQVLPSKITSYRRFLQAVSSNSTGCDSFDNEEDCLNGGSNCRWRPNFNSCYADNNGGNDDECTNSIIPDPDFKYVNMKLDGVGKLSPSAVATWENVTSDFVSDYLKNTYNADDGLEMETSMLCQNGVRQSNRRRLQTSPTSSTNNIVYKQRIVGEFESDGRDLRELLTEPFQNSSKTDQYITKLKEKEIAENGNASEFGSLKEIDDIQDIVVNNSTSAPSMMPSQIPSTAPTKENNSNKDPIKLILIISGVVIGLLLCIILCLVVIWVKLRKKSNSQDQDVHEEQQDDVSMTALHAVTLYDRGNDSV